jgi:UDP-N-acetylmuramyl pentapeptide phosphotransferase/UDP-N-acetylglucosamine-1-phosphate transferase
MAAALSGFFIWNYPRGLIFLGDGGAYLSGFWIALISILMVTRHKEISPWFALVVNGYPIMETLFTIYRRIIHQGKNPGNPDGIHFHSLLYRRVLSVRSPSTKNSPYLLNARTSPYLWIVTTLCVIPAILFRNSTPLLVAAAFLFALTYIWIYKRIVRFKTPKFMSDFGAIDY